MVSRMLRSRHTRCQSVTRVVLKGFCVVQSVRVTLLITLFVGIALSVLAQGGVVNQSIAAQRHSGTALPFASNEGPSHAESSHSSRVAASIALLHTQGENGNGAGAAVPNGWCWFDISCWMQSIAQWVAQQIVNALQPLIQALNNSPLNILTQTPAVDTYQDPTLVAWWTAFVQVVDLAMACMIVIGGFNAVVSGRMGEHADLAAFVPRLILAYGAAHFSLYFLGLFIDLENELCAMAVHLAGVEMLTNLILGIFQGNLSGVGLITWVLIVALGVMDLLLGLQMVVRLGLLWVLISLAGPGLFCLALPQTAGYGRMWLSLTAATVMVQFFQVTALALGGILITSLGAINIFNAGQTIAICFVSIALLFLVLRIPGIVHRHALRPMMEASSAYTHAYTQAVQTAARAVL